MKFVLLSIALLPLVLANVVDNEPYYKVIFHKGELLIESRNVVGIEKSPYSRSKFAFQVNLDGQIREKFRINTGDNSRSFVIESVVPEGDKVFCSIDDGLDFAEEIANSPFGCDASAIIRPLTPEESHKINQAIKQLDGPKDHKLKVVYDHGSILAASGDLETLIVNIKQKDVFVSTKSRSNNYSSLTIAKKDDSPVKSFVYASTSNGSECDGYDFTTDIFQIFCRGPTEVRDMA